MIANDAQYSMEEVAIAKMAMRRAAGVAVERLTPGAFIDALSGEIDMLRNCSFADEEIVAVIARAIGREVEVEPINQSQPLKLQPQTQHDLSQAAC
jgi:hypothetical protein